MTNHDTARRISPSGMVHSPRPPTVVDNVEQRRLAGLGRASDDVKAAQGELDVAALAVVGIDRDATKLQGHGVTPMVWRICTGAP